MTCTTGLTYGYGYVATADTEGEYELRALYKDLSTSILNFLYDFMP
ncbi:MAG TPA: hypothetical protein PLI09_17870 [Candidatus Hydrogenedentes bacterium]|nr:hypothetical protein [Candidatus Hydrogenedentota bacterium]